MGFEGWEEEESAEESSALNEALGKLKDPEIIRRHLEEGKTFQEILGYDAGKMEEFYKTAFEIFQKQDYQKAADAFVFLTTLNPCVCHYWLGLGMSEQLSGEFQAALLAYAMATLTDVENPLAYYHSATCYLLLKDTKSAEQSLMLAIRCAEGRGGYDIVKERALEAKKALEK